MSDVVSEESSLLKSVPIRPLAKGMYNDRISQLVEPGGAIDLQGYDVTPYGLSTMHGLRSIYQDGGFPYIEFLTDSERVEELDALITPDGVVNIFAITQKFIYGSSDLRTWSPIKWCQDYSGWTVSNGNTQINLPTVSFVDDKVQTGFKIKVPLAGDTYSIHTITTVGTTTLQVAETIGTVNMNIPLEIYCNFTCPYGNPVQYARTPTYVFFVDGSGNGVRYFDGNYIRDYPMYLMGADGNTSEPTWSGASAVAFIGGRLLLGGLQESGGRLRVRWSLVTALDQFYVDDWADFVSGQGSVQRITNVEDFVVVFMDDSMVVGQPYGFDASYTAPWLWRPILSAGASPVGPRAYTTIPGALIFMGSDDLYRFSPLQRTEKGDFYVEPFKCTVRRTFVDSKRPRDTLLRFDAIQGRLLVLVCGATERSYADVHVMNLATGEWSHRGLHGVTFSNVCLFTLRDIATWQDWLDKGYEWIDPALDAAWVTFLAKSNGRVLLFVNSSGGLYFASPGASNDEVYAGEMWFSLPMTRIYETADIDMGSPDVLKTFRKLALRLRRDGSQAKISFDVSVSTQKGRAGTWKTLPPIVVQADEDEGEIHFAARGELVRFRFVTKTEVDQFTLEELTFRVRLSGRQVIRNT